MADNSSKLKAQIEFLTNLIKSHKQTGPQVSGSGSHVSSMNNNVNNNGRSFSWQRSKQPEKEKKQPVSGPPHSQVEGQPAVVKSSYSLDRRKISGNSSGSNTTMTSLNVSAIPGSSGLSLNTEVTKSVSNVNKGVLKQNDSQLAVSKPAVSSKTTILHGLPQAVSPPKSVNTTQPSLTNPYVLNKKETLSVSGGKTVAQKSELKWSKPSASSVSSSDDSKSHSDSELHTKKSNLPRTGQLSSLFFTKGKSTALIHPKVTSLSNVQGSFKWSKTEPTASSSLGQKKSVTKKSKLKWTKPGVRVQVGSKRQLNPYVLRKENMASRSAGHKGVAFSKTSSKSKVIKRPLYSAQNRTSHVWRSQSALKLDRRDKVQSNVESVSKKALSRRLSAGFIERRQRAVLRESPVVTRYSVVRSKRKQAPIKAQKLNKVVVIGGVPYKTSSNKLTKAKIYSTDKESGRSKSNLSNRKFGKLTKTVNIQGEKFVMDSKGKTLQRVNKAPRHLDEPSSSKQSQMSSGRRRSSTGHVVILRTPTTLVRSKLSSNPSKTLASRVLRRSIHNARLYKKNKKKPASQQYCMFYNRFGKCNKQDTCPYIHDPSKVAVCTKFLRGRCKNVDGSCPFSHKIDRDKMPVCQFFLRGKCSNDNCAYSHVNVSKKAEVCEDFLKGFCSRGQQCNKKHILECEEFSRTGKCSKGSKCKLMHRARKPAAGRKRKSSEEEEKESLKHSKLDFTSDEGFLPLTGITASASDSEQTSAQDPLVNTPEETKEMTVEPVVIRPRFLKPKEPEKSSEPTRIE